MADVFPHGFYAMGVEQAMDWDEKTGRRSASKDKQADGQFVWTVTGIDRDPEAREKQVKVKVTAPVQPVLPGEIMPGSGLHAVEFTGLTITPYVNEGAGSGAVGVLDPGCGRGRSGQVPNGRVGPPPGDGRAAMRLSA